MSQQLIAVIESGSDVGEKVGASTDSCDVQMLSSQPTE